MARKSKTDELFETLRAGGLRKRAARDISSALSAAEKGGSAARGAGAKAIDDLRALVSDLEGRVTGGGTSAKRKAGARKAAATRKRAATKRSAAARKGAAKRSASGAARSTRSTTKRAGSAAKRTTKRAGSSARSGAKRAGSTARSGAKRTGTGARRTTSRSTSRRSRS
jgi:hypothetical protein